MNPFFQQWQQQNYGGSPDPRPMGPPRDYASPDPRPMGPPQAAPAPTGANRPGYGWRQERRDAVQSGQYDPNAPGGPDASGATGANREGYGWRQTRRQERDAMGNAAAPAPSGSMPPMVYAGGSATFNEGMQGQPHPWANFMQQKFGGQGPGPRPMGPQNTMDPMMEQPDSTGANRPGMGYRRDRRQMKQNGMYDPNAQMGDPNMQFGDPSMQFGGMNNFQQMGGMQQPNPGMQAYGQMDPMGNYQQQGRGQNNMQAQTLFNQYPQTINWGGGY